MDAGGLESTQSRRLSGLLLSIKSPIQCDGPPLGRPTWAVGFASSHTHTTQADRGRTRRPTSRRRPARDPLLALFSRRWSLMGAFVVRRCRSGRFHGYPQNGTVGLRSFLLGRLLPISLDQALLATHESKGLASIPTPCVQLEFCWRAVGLAVWPPAVLALKSFLHSNWGTPMPAQGFSVKTWVMGLLTDDARPWGFSQRLRASAARPPPATHPIRPTSPRRVRSCRLSVVRSPRPCGRFAQKLLLPCLNVVWCCVV